MGLPHLPVDRHRGARGGIFVALALVVTLVAGGYLLAGALAYDDLSRLNPDCGGGFAGQTPSNVEAREHWGRSPVRFNAARYRFADYTEASFPSRTPGITIRGWWARDRAPANGRAVILVHGRGSCRRDPVVLLPAGMLHRAGLGVLVMELRDHGSSSREDGRWAAGVEEYEDVLGAWDWLVGRGYEPDRIGVFGASMGGGTVAMALGREPGLRAAFLDSAPANIEIGAREYAEDHGYPGLLAPAAFLAARLISRDDLTALSPDTELRNLGGRPLFIVHGTADSIVRVHHATDLAAAAAAGGTRVTPWIVDGAGHVQVVYRQPDAYEEAIVDFFDASLGG